VDVVSGLILSQAKATTFRIDVGPANEEEELITTSEFVSHPLT
jgi:hypothetical protein